MYLHYMPRNLVFVHCPSPPQSAKTVCHLGSVSLKGMKRIFEKIILWMKTIHYPNT